MAFHQRQPAPPLDTWIDAVWVCHNAPRPRSLEKVLPLPGAQLIVNLAEDETRTYHAGSRELTCLRSAGSTLTGITTRFQIIDTDEQMHVAGVAFKPGGTKPFASVPANELCNVDAPLDVLWGRQRTSLLREQLLECRDAFAALDVLEQTLLALWQHRRTHASTDFALRAFQAGPAVARIGRIAEATGTSTRTFIERFTSDVGVTPKRFCRLLRFHRAVSLAHGAHAIDWPDLALSCGYVDQAHLIHEFREFSGLSPTGYDAGRTIFQNHVNFLQAPAPSPRAD